MQSSALYQRLEDARTAMQTTLFHALFISWPDQLYALVQEGLPPGRSLQQNRDLRLKGDLSKDVTTQLKQLFDKALALYAQQAFQRSFHLLVI